MHAIWKPWSCEMKQSLVDVFCLDRDGWCLACRALSVFPPFPRLFCLASPESCYVFGQFPSYLLLHSNCHCWSPSPVWSAMLPSPPGNRLFSIPHPECNTRVWPPPLTFSPNNITFTHPSPYLHFQLACHHMFTHPALLLSQKPFFSLVISVGPNTINYSLHTTDWKAITLLC